jgi:hypothetical protein
MPVPYSITDTTVTVVCNFVPKVISKSHPNFEAIKTALQEGKEEKDIAPLLDIPAAIASFTDGEVVVKNGQLFFRGYEVRNSLSRLIIGLMKEGKDEAAKPFKNFLVKAFANPDPRAALDLYDWVVHSGLPITPDGDILAWKAVREDYYSIHDGGRNKKFDHHVGNFLEQDRTLCDANPDRTCSSGLHFCAAGYLKSYGSGGSRIVALKISPTDVVAFPRDYGWEKGRACKYQVVGEVPLDKVPDFYPQGKRIYRGYEKSGKPSSC